MVWKLLGGTKTVHRHKHTHRHTHTHRHIHKHTHTYTEAYFISLVFLRKCRNKTKKLVHRDHSDIRPLLQQAAFVTSIATYGHKGFFSSVLFVVNDIQGFENLNVKIAIEYGQPELITSKDFF